MRKVWIGTMGVCWALLNVSCGDIYAQEELDHDREVAQTRFASTVEKEGREEPNCGAQRLSMRDVDLLNTTIAYFESTTRDSADWCEFETNGWVCQSGIWYCQCDHSGSTGPDCSCIPAP